MRKSLQFASGIVLWGALGCGAEPEGVSDGEAADGAELDLSGRVALLEHDLAPGDAGEEVRALHDYLTRYGYFPNEELAREYSRWQPIVAEAPEDPLLYGPITEQAVRSLQRNMGISETGTVDAATRALLKLPRCAVPDGTGHSDVQEKFALHDKWSKTSLKYLVTNADDVTLTQARTAAQSALAAWSQVTGLSFTRVTDNSYDFSVLFVSIDGAGNKLAQAWYPEDGAHVHVDPAETWSVATPTPTGATDLQNVLMHEFGHSLGLDHSSLTTARMYPFSNGVAPARTLGLDDKVAISAYYDQWTQVSGCAKSLGAGGTVWAIQCTSSGDGAVVKWNGGSNWMADAAGGLGARIDVDVNGIPWVVTGGGGIYKRSSSNPASGSWTQLPGCAKDIGIGKDGTVWIIGCGAGQDGAVFKWTGSSWAADDGVGMRITVGDTGVPLVVHSNGGIYQRSSGAITSTQRHSWNPLPGAARDAGLYESSYTWIAGTGSTGGGSPIYVWNQQSALGSNAPQRWEWVNVPGGAVDIDVGTSARPWVVANDGSIWTSSK